MKPIAGEYVCPCGKRGEHRHSEPFPGDVEGCMERGGTRYEIRRSPPGARPTWRAREVSDG